MTVPRHWLLLFLFSILIPATDQASAQMSKQKITSIETNGARRGSTCSSADFRRQAPNPGMDHRVKTPLKGRGQPPSQRGGDPYEPVWMSFDLDWTNVQIHRVDNDTPIEVLLSGNISSSNVLHWNLFSISPEAGIPPLLYFVEDVLGNPGYPSGPDIQLHWEISINGGPFAPIALLPDNSVTTSFPAGENSFQVRITGLPQYHQPNGYYMLQLGQEIVPEL